MNFGEKIEILLSAGRGWRLDCRQEPNLCVVEFFPFASYGRDFRTATTSFEESLLQLEREINNSLKAYFTAVDQPVLYQHLHRFFNHPEFGDFNDLYVIFSPHDPDPMRTNYRIKMGVSYTSGTQLSVSSGGDTVQEVFEEVIELVEARLPYLF